MTRVITHDRVFHADESFAVAILKMVYPELQVLRTRDPEVLRTQAGLPDTFLLDVGCAYDAANRLFDHHQPEGAGWRNSDDREWPYATAGLVWKHYGEAAVRCQHPTLSDDGVQETLEYVDESVIKYIDAVDCGIRLRTAGPSLSGLIASFNSAWYEQEADAFPLVANLAQVILSNFIKRQAGKILARDKVRASPVLLNGAVLLLEACVPWVDVVSADMPNILFVVYPVDADGGQQWQVRAAVNPGMIPRIKFPLAWAGREHGALARASGVAGAVFCHRSQHLAGATTQHGALSLAEQALTAQEDSLLQVAA